MTFICLYCNPTVMLICFVVLVFNVFWVLDRKRECGSASKGSGCAVRHRQRTHAEWTAGSTSRQTPDKERTVNTLKTVWLDLINRKWFCLDTQIMLVVALWQWDIMERSHPPAEEFIRGSGGCRQSSESFGTNHHKTARGSKPHCYRKRYLTTRKQGGKLYNYKSRIFMGALLLFYFLGPCRLTGLSRHVMGLINKC